MWKIILCVLMAITSIRAETHEELMASVYKALEISDEKLSDSALFASLNMEVPTLKKKPQAVLEQPKDEVPWKEISFAGTTLLTWISMGINEGQKWKYDRTGEIDFMWRRDYRLYRGVHNTGLLVAPLIALSMDKNKSSVKWIVGSNFMGWGLYEVALAYASSESITGAKPKFTILDAEFNRPSSIACLMIAALSTVAVTYSF